MGVAVTGPEVNIKVPPAVPEGVPESPGVDDGLPEGRFCVFEELLCIGDGVGVGVGEGVIREFLYI